jgi:hypothetical protein
MDCEGAEYEIIFSLTQSILQRIGAVTMEYHDGVTAYSHQDLVEFFISMALKCKFSRIWCIHIWGIFLLKGAI